MLSTLLFHLISRDSAILPLKSFESTFGSVIVIITRLNDSESRKLTSDDIDPRLGQVPDAGVTGVAAGVREGRVLDQQERGGRGSWEITVQNFPKKTFLCFLRLKSF